MTEDACDDEVGSARDAAMAGDRSLVDALVVRQLSYVRRRVRGRMPRGRGADADDLVQEVMVALLTRLSGLRFANRDGLRAYVDGIIHNQIVNLLRRRPYLDLDRTNEPMARDDQASSVERADSLGWMLRVLPDRERPLLHCVMRGVEREYAGAAGCTLTAMRMRKSRLLAKIRRLADAG